MKYIVGKRIIPEESVDFCEKALGDDDRTILRIYTRGGHLINLRGEDISTFLDQYMPKSDFITRVYKPEPGEPVVVPADIWE